MFAAASLLSGEKCTQTQFSQQANKLNKLEAMKTRKNKKNEKFKMCIFIGKRLTTAISSSALNRFCRLLTNFLVSAPKSAH